MNKHRIKGNGTVIALILAMADPVQAGAVGRLPKRMLSASDRAAIFGVDSRFPVALLSEDEMAETKGALWPFVGNWVQRLGWGTLYGMAYSAWSWWNSQNENGEQGTPKLFGEFTMMSSIVWLVSTNLPVAADAGLTAAIIYDSGGINESIRRLRTIGRERGESLGDTVDRVNSAISRVAESNLRQERTSPVTEAMSLASESPETDRFLTNLTNSLDRDLLRGFLSRLPTRSMNYWLDKFAPGMSREDFLQNLPANTVNDVLISISEEQMGRFVSDVVPQYIRDAVAPTSTPNVHWVY